MSQTQTISLDSAETVRSDESVDSCLPARAGDFSRMQGENGKYSLQIKRMARLVQDQQQLKQAVSRTAWYRFDRKGGVARHVRTTLPPVAQSLLQRALSNNAWTLTHANIALAFCRNRLRRGSPDLADRHNVRGAYVWAWIVNLSHDSGWTNVEAIKAHYASWRAWCDSFALGVALPRPVTLPWQREVLRRARSAKRFRRLARSQEGK